MRSDRWIAVPARPRFNARSQAIVRLEAHNMPARLLVRQAESLRELLLPVAGVKKVTILGERPERIFVNFSYARLANLGVSARDVFAALQNQNAITPAGS